MLDYKSRLQGVNVWNSLVFILNGLIFLLIGLQLPLIIRQLGEISLGKAIWYGLAITFILIITRLICTFCASVFSTFMSRFITVAEPNPGWKLPLIHGWAGIRGVVSLAAALSIPLYISAGKAFPYRDLILFITFIVILVTLVLQGLTLPWLIRKLDVKEKDSAIPGHEQEKRIQRKIARHSLERIEEKFNNEKITNEYLKNLHAKLKTEIDFFNRELAESENITIDSRIEYQKFYLELLEEQRKLLEDINLRAEFDEDIIRKYQSLIDLEEYKIREKFVQDPSVQ
jgi:NhaP-type Na+/H+ or K+/H+ antiporter